MKVRVTKHASMIISDRCFSLLCFTILLYIYIYIYNEIFDYNFIILLIIGYHIINVIFIFCMHIISIVANGPRKQALSTSHS